jgi:hypothetical protein
MLATIWLKIKGWLAAIGAILLAIGGAYLYGRVKQKSSDKTDAEKLQEQQVQEVTKINQQNADVRQGVEDMIHGLPPAAPAPQVPAPVGPPTNVQPAANKTSAPAPAEIPVKIADANPNSSTGRLSEWARDNSSSN